MRSRIGNIYFSGLWPYLPNTICLLNALFSLQDCIKEKNKGKGFKHYLFFKTIVYIIDSESGLPLTPGSSHAGPLPRAHCQQVSMCPPEHPICGQDHT